MHYVIFENTSNYAHVNVRDGAESLSSSLLRLTSLVSVSWTVKQVGTSYYSAAEKKEPRW